MNTHSTNGYAHAHALQNKHPTRSTHATSARVEPMDAEARLAFAIVTDPLPGAAEPTPPPASPRGKLPASMQYFAIAKARAKKAQPTRKSVAKVAKKDEATTTPPAGPPALLPAPK